MKEKVQTKLKKIKKQLTLEKLKTDSKCKPNKKRKTKKYFRIYKQITKRLRKILKVVLSKSLKRFLDFIKLDTSEINLSLLIDELSKYERKKTNDLQKLQMKNKVIVRKLTRVLKRKKNFLNKDAKTALKDNKLFLKDLRKTITFKTIPFVGPKQEEFKKKSSLNLKSLKQIVSDKKLPKGIKRWIKKIIRMQEDLVNKILIISEMKLNTNLQDKDISGLKTRISEIRSLDIDVNEVFYLVDVELKYQERVQKRKTNIISNSNENLNELELIIPRVKEKSQADLKELINLFRIFINETNKASQVEDVIHLRNVLTFYEELQNKWSKDNENKKLLQQLLSLYLQMKSNSPKNSKLIPRAFKKLGELKWIENKMDDKQKEKKLVTNFTKVLESTFDNFKHELEIEMSALKILDEMRALNNSLSEDDSVNDQLIELLPTNFELLKQLKFYIWDNENVNPELLAPVNKIFLKIIQEVSQSKEKIDLNNILLKITIYPDTFTAESQEEKVSKKIVSKVIEAKQKCFACNLIAVLNKIKAKLFMDQEEKERREDSLNDILGSIQKLQKNKNDSVKKLAGELKTLTERLQDMLEMEHDPYTLSLLDRDLVDMFKKIEDMEEESISFDVQGTFEDLIRKLLKLIHDQLTFEADDDEAHLDASQELVNELNTLISSDMNIFSDEPKRKLEEILKGVDRINNWLKLGLDLLSDEDIEEIKSNSALIINNIDTVMAGQKLTSSIGSILEELKEFTEKQLDDSIKENDKRITLKLENLFEELNSVYDGPNQKIVDDLESQETEILDTFLKISDIGIESMSEEEISNLEKSKEKVSSLMKSLLADGKVTTNVKKVLKKIEDFIKEIDDRFDNLLSSKEIDERNEIIELLSNEPPDLDKQGMIAYDTIIEKLPLCNELIGKILTNGIESLTPDNLKLLRETQNLISSSLKILKSKDISQSMKESLKQIEDIITKDKDLIQQKEHENEYDKQKDQIFDILDELHKDGPKEELDPLLNQLKIITELQEKIASEGHESLTEQEISSLESNKKAMKQKMEEILKNPKLDKTFKDKIKEIGNLVDKANDSILSKMDIDNIEQLIKNLEAKFRVLRNFTNHNKEKNLEKFQLKFKQFIDKLKLLITPNLEKLELKVLFIIENLAQELTDSILDVYRNKQIELPLSILMDQVKVSVVESVGIVGSTILSLRAKSLTTLLTNLISGNEKKVLMYM